MKKLIEQLNQGTFYYSKFGLNIKANIFSVVEMDCNTLYISFEGGACSLYIDKLQKVYSPSNVVRGVYKWCYKLNNQQNDLIGFIALKENAIEKVSKNERRIKLNQVNTLEEFKKYILELKEKREREGKEIDFQCMGHIATSLGARLVKNERISKEDLDRITYLDIDWLK